MLLSRYKFSHILKLAFIVFFIATAGCATTDVTRTKAEGTAAGVAIGATAGAGVGAIIGAMTGSTSTGAVVGAGTGALIGSIAGYFYGDSVADKKAAYIQRETNLRLASADIDNSLKITKDYNTQLANDIVALQEREKLLTSKRMKKSALKRNLKEQKIQTEHLLASSEQQLAMLKTKLSEQQNLIAKEEAPDNPPEIQKSILLAKTNISVMDSEQQTLQSYIDQLKQIDSRRAY